MFPTNHPARYLFFVAKGAAYAACLIFAGMVARNIAEGYFFTSMSILRIAGIIILVVLGGVFYRSFNNDLSAVIAKRPMPSFTTRFTDHGLTIYSVTEAIRNEDVEFLAVFSETGLKLAEVTNFHENMVRVGQIIKSSTFSPGTTMVHNHPGGNGAFSPNDISAFMYYQCSRAIVVTKDKTYEVAFPRKYSKAEAKRVRKRLKQLIRQTKSDKSYVLANEAIAKEFGYTFCQREAATSA